MSRFSHRLIWDLPPNVLSQALADVRSKGTDIIDLTVSNPTEVLQNYPHVKIAAAFGELRDLAYYPHPAGTPEAREIICNGYRQAGVTLDPNQLVLSASTSEAYAQLFKLLCDPDDEILVPTPSYPLFEYLARLENVNVRPYRLEYDGSWFLDFNSVDRHITERTRAIVVVNPNNPTGSYLKSADRDRLVAVAVERNLSIISDEVFHAYAVDTNRTQVSFVDEQRALCFTLNGLSKSAGMPQLKLAWTVVGGPATQVASAVDRLHLIADTFLSVNTPTQLALPALLGIAGDIHAALSTRVKTNWRTLARLLEQTPMDTLHLEAGWSAIIRLPMILREQDWVIRFLREGSVLVQPGYYFDMEQETYAVVSLITSPDTFEIGIRRMVQLVGIIAES